MGSCSTTEARRTGPGHSGAAELKSPAPESSEMLTASSTLSAGRSPLRTLRTCTDQEPYCGPGRPIQLDQKWFWPEMEVRTAFERGSLLGRGAYGEVRAVRLRGRTVAVKRVPLRFCDDTQREVEVLHKLHHDCLLHLLGVAAADGMGHTFLVTDLMEGGNLECAICSDVPAPPLRLVQAVADAASGLAELHRLGVLHRDFKPMNVLLCKPIDSDDVPQPLAKLADFGLTKMTASAGVERSWTAVVGGNCVGTVGYMAPETQEGRFAPASDVYSVGITLLQVLTGKRARTRNGVGGYNWLALLPLAEAESAAGGRGWRNDVPPRPDAVYEVAIRASHEDLRCRPPALAVASTLRALACEDDGDDDRLFLSCTDMPET
eukprot:TRINITY_DN10093_c0_g1_i1.p1 TRINITY_DN10093_c0_g1~~TRINITY_DN10093_c0_g1_i1.p1  ORF type:complete len:394 (+),score=94.77 TRINITY_DN10093_c0_g1_i1:54-1184(+)